MTRRLDNPPTLAEWREWAETATRNWTDDEIGRHTEDKRRTDAANSRYVRSQPRPRPATTPEPETVTEEVAP